MVLQKLLCKSLISCLQENPQKSYKLNNLLVLINATIFLIDVLIENLLVIWSEEKFLLPIMSVKIDVLLSRKTSFAGRARFA